MSVITEGDPDDRHSFEDVSGWVLGMIAYIWLLR
jgi:hypothetical protein